METEPGATVFPIARGSSSTFWFTAAVVGFTMILPLVVLMVPLWPDRTDLEVSDAGVRITGSMYGRLIPLADLGNARKLTAEDMTDYRTAARTNGVGLPNYLGGWFRLGNGSNALVFLTDSSRSVIVPTTEGYTLLASPEDPDGFLSALAGFKSAGGGGKSPAGRFPLAPAVTGNSSMLVYVAVAGMAPVLLAGLLGGLTWA